MDAIAMLRKTVELPRIPVRATNLHGDRDTRHIVRYSRRVPAMSITDIKLLTARIHYMSDAERHSLSASEIRGLYMLLRVLREEEVRRFMEGK
jgi:hypothetical protein